MTIPTRSKDQLLVWSFANAFAALENDCSFWFSSFSWIEKSELWIMLCSA